MQRERNTVLPPMLPDFPDVKALLAARLASIAQKTAHADPLVSDLPAFRQHEGNRARIDRVDGTSAVISYDNPISATATISLDDTRKLGSRASLEAVKKMGEALGEKVSIDLIKKIEEAAESAGNVVKGLSLSADTLLQTFEKMELDFDEDEKWLPPSLVIHPDRADKVGLELQKLESDPDVKRRLDALLTTKRQEWRAREARRKLVD